MIAAIHQPYFIPYIGYWQLISSADLFAIADNYNFITKGWINRNRILNGEKVQWFNVSVKDISQNRDICDHDVLIAPHDKKKKMRQLQGSYCHAPHLSEGLELMDRMLSFEGNNLADFLYDSIQMVCDYLQIDTKIVRSSDYEQDPTLKFADRVYDYCHQMGADTYHNLIGGLELYSFDEFADHGIQLAILEPIIEPYPQSSTAFEPRLSILDVIMNNSVEEIQEMLKSYRLITEPEEPKA